MYKVYTDKQEIFECNIDVEGASLNEAKARLIFENEHASLIFPGTINSSGKCSIPIQKLKNILPESTKGNLHLEVIVEDTYFKPWEDSCEVVTSKKLQVEVKSQQETKEVNETNKIKPFKITVEVKNNLEKHASSIYETLKENNININNIKTKKNKLNSIISEYCNNNDVENKEDLIKEILKKLTKK